MPGATSSVLAPFVAMPFGTSSFLLLGTESSLLFNNMFSSWNCLCQTNVCACAATAIDPHGELIVDDVWIHSFQPAMVDFLDLLKWTWSFSTCSFYRKPCCHVLAMTKAAAPVVGEIEWLVISVMIVMHMYELSLFSYPVNSSVSY